MEPSSNEEHLRTALHEAAHAIIGESLGVRVESFRLSPVKHSNYTSAVSTGHTQFAPHTLIIKDEIVISLAGPLAEQRQFGDCPDIAFRGDMDTMRIQIWRSILFFRKEPDPGFEYISQEVAKGNIPREVEDALARLIQDHTPRLLEMLNCPHIWDAISELAGAIMEKPELSGDEVRRILRQCLDSK